MGPDRTTGDLRQTRVLDSWRLVAESKRLLICLHERRAQMGHPADAQAMLRLRGELDLAQRKCNANRTAAARAHRSPRLDRTYRSLIRRATACAESLASAAPKLAPEAQFRAAVSVQMIDELVHEWTDAVSQRGA